MARFESFRIQTDGATLAVRDYAGDGHPIVLLHGGPGMGDYFVRSVLNRDQTLILGTVMVYSFFLLSLNLMVDVMYSVVDPRIQLTQRKA